MNTWRSFKEDLSESIDENVETERKMLARQRAAFLLDGGIYSDDG